MIAAQLTLEHHRGVPVIADLAWTETDPFAVLISFHSKPDSDPIEWYVARDLLYLGMRQSAGNGDIRVERTSEDQVVLTLDSPNGHADFLVDARELANFLSRTFNAVPLGAEMDMIDLDSELAEMLREAA